MSRHFLLVSFLFFLTPISWSAVGTEVLPAGVRSPSIRIGNISQLNEQYSESGSLTRSVDIHSFQFDAKRLSTIEPKLSEVVSLFNRMGQYELGSKLNKGTLQVNSTPEIQYTGVIFAYGVNDHWTVGGGIPVVHYRNAINVSATPGNVGVFRKIAEGLSPELDEGLKTLDETDLVQAFRSELQKKGYNDLVNQDKTFLGDFQFSSLYRLENVNSLESLVRVNISLPTGPQFDPDNLAALNQFGYTYIEPQIIVATPLLAEQRLVTGGFKVAGLLGVRYYLQDQITARVPLNEDDVLPDASQKESVRRNVGLKFTQAAQLSWNMNEYFTLFGISEFSQKSQDRYEGSEGRRYDLLGKDTDTQTTVVTGGMTFSSVAAYQKRQKGFPAIVTLQISDTIAGKNTERQLIQELTGIMFF